MYKPFASFTDSAREMRKIRCIAVTGLLIALHTVLAVFVSAYITQSVRISVSFAVKCVTGALYGPVVGLVAGIIEDLLQFIIKPTGPYFFGWTLNSALEGLLCGLFFYRCRVFEAPRPAVAEGKNQSESGREAETPQQIFRHLLFPAAGIVLLLILPFLSVCDESGKVIFTGTALDAVRGSAPSAVLICAVIIFACLLIQLASAFLGLRIVSCAAGIAAAFIPLLIAYSDRKTTTPGSGFLPVVFLIMLQTVMLLFELVRSKVTDTRRLLVCFLAMGIDAVVINALLGTVWITMMYGKGFEFYFTARLIKSLIQLPVNTLIAYYCVALTVPIKKLR